MALTDSHWESKNGNRKAKGKLVNFSLALLGGAPSSSVLPWIPFLAPDVWAGTYFMAPLDNYLFSSDMPLEKSACCSLSCCSISSKCFRKLWHTVLIVSISGTVHWEQLERAEKEGLSESLQEFTTVAPAFPPGLTCLRRSPAANVSERD